MRYSTSGCDCLLLSCTEKIRVLIKFREKHSNQEHYRFRDSREGRGLAALAATWLCGGL